MAVPIYRHYDQAGLDREYDNRTKEPGYDFAGFLARCAAHSARARQTLAAHLDVGFGPSASDTLDIFPGAGAQPTPVEVFFHGGYWRMGHKDDFDYVALGLVPHGVTTVIVNYALIPTVTMDELVEQCRRALGWVAGNIARYGGDPDRIHIFGHSAGAQLAAMMMATDWRQRAHAISSEPFNSAVAVSGIYDLEPVRLCFLNSILRLTAADAARNSPMRLVPKVRVQLTLAVGDREGDEYLRQTQDFADAWRAHGVACEVVVRAATNHFDIREQWCDPNSEMTELVLRHMRAR